MRFITLDIESPYDTHFSLEKLTYESYVRDDRFRINGLGYKIDDGPAQYVYDPDEIPVVLEELFPEDNDNVMICHNTLFDGAVVNWLYGVRAHRYWCTESMSRMLWNQRSASLEQLAISCFPDDKTKRKGKELQDFKGILRELTEEEQEVLGGYCINDVELTFACCQQMHKWLPESAFRVMDIVLKMYVLPLFVLDREATFDYLQEVKANTDRLVEASGVSREVLASNDKFAQWILDHDIPFAKVASPTPNDPNNMKWPLAKTAEEFIRIQQRYPEHAAVWDARLAVKSTIERTRAQRLLDHAEVGPLNPDGVLGMPCKVSGAHTHRLGGTNKINPQNLKRGSQLRRSLMAPEGCVVLVGDSSNIELRMCAWLAGEEEVLKKIAAGADLYCEYASEVFGREITKDDFEERFLGKVCELSLQYMTGAPRLQHTLATGAMGGPRMHYSDDACRVFVNTYRTRRMKTVKLWRQADHWLEHMAMKKAAPITYKCLIFEHQRVRLPNGLYLNYPELRATEGQRGWEFTYWNGKFHANIYGAKLVENLVQALSQVVLQGNMIDFADYLETLETGQIVLQVHDEIVAIVDDEDKDEALDTLFKIMKTVPAWCGETALTLDAEGGYAAEYSK